MTSSFETYDEARLSLLRQAAAQWPDSADLLFRLSQGLAEAGKHEESAAVFRRAFLKQPSGEFHLFNTAGDTPRARAQALRTRAVQLIEHGVLFSPVIAALAIGEARSGNTDAVRSLVDYARFFRCARIDPPDGVAPSDCLDELSRDIKSDLTYRELRTGNTGEGWYNMNILRSESPAGHLFLRMIHREIARYIADLPTDPSHPFLASRPERFSLHGWAVVSDSATHHTPHYHPKAWLSGIYYVKQPDISRQAGTDRGWLRVGPHLGVTTGQGWDERHVAPEAGTLVLMPGYFYHSTVAMGVDQERICIAFDVVPDVLAGGGSGQDGY